MSLQTIYKIRHKIENMSKWPIYFAMIFFGSCDCVQHIEGTAIEQVCVPDPDVLDAQKVWRMPFEGKQAEFPGGQIAYYKYLSQLRYPAEQIEWQGSIFITFVVDKTGKIRNECIAKRYFEGELSPVEKEALRLIAEMPRWTPAEINGKKVYSRVFLPIKF